MGVLSCALLALVVMMGLVLGLSTKAYALDPVKYLDENGEEKWCEDYNTTIEDGVLDGSSHGGWYVISGTSSFDRLRVGEGDVKLILCDDSVLTIHTPASMTTGGAGIFCFYSYGLTIYAQSDNEHTGRLDVTSEQDAHGGISLKQVTINGGIINASATSNSRNTYGILGDNGLTINGGKVTAQSTGASAIRSNKQVAIHGGTVDATGSSLNGMHGIDGYQSVLIDGGTIDAKGMDGICTAGTITIQDGDVRATSITNNVGLGATEGIFINGGKVVASGVSKCLSGALTLSNDRGIWAGADEASASLTNPKNWEHKEKWALIDKAVPVTGVMLDKATASIEPTDTVQLSATVKPDDATYSDAKFLSWESDEEGVATVDAHGLVTGVSDGVATITLRSDVYDDILDTCVVTVKTYVPASSVVLDESELDLETGKTGTLTATVNPDAADQSVVWASDNESVATVDESGVVTAVAPGEAIITVTSVDNEEAKAECKVTVKDPVPAGGDMFRLYNPYTGEHFYTASAEERDAVEAAGWTYEGVGWKAPAEGAPVFRLYNPYAGDHHYTLSEFEHDMLVSVGWSDEGIGWCSAGENGVPIYRQYNPYAEVGTHNYTTSKDEVKSLVKLGWLAEGIGWYGL